MISSILPRAFYLQDTVVVAKKLLGKKIVRKIEGKAISGIITETEAYRHKDDPASHAYRNMTDRNRAMFEEVGRAYVYFTYGMYYCFNVVARSPNSDAGAVLIRAIKPEDGIDIIVKNRKNAKYANLTNGPAKITQALQISKQHYGLDLTKKGDLFISEGINHKKIAASPRIGIKTATENKWNFKINI